MHRINELIKDEDRYQDLTLKVDINGEFIYADFSKTHIEVRNLKQKIAQIDRHKIEKMFNKEKINFTENQSVLHTHCRSQRVLANLRGAKEQLDKDESQIYASLITMERLCRDFHEQKLRGATGKPLKTVVNIGIGGSDLGPRMVAQALDFYKKGPTPHFISNIDPTELDQVFSQIDPAETLFIVVSKTFTTQETLSNARLARKKVCSHLMVEEAQANTHFVAVTANPEEAAKFGIQKTVCMPQGVGGRYSLWSSCGLSIALSVGFNNFLDMLDGAAIMDAHYRQQEACQNLPIVHAIVEDFYNNTMGYDNVCILPYDTYLRLLPAYLQQAEMESNGKSAAEAGFAGLKTGMIVWGGVGTDCQHSFFQLVHQGTRNILCEFLLPLSTLSDAVSHHKELVANCVAQSLAMMDGRRSDDPHRNFDGDRPSITIAYSRLTPAVLGALIALYEHKIVTQGFMWGINSFDQFGVTLGKQIAKEIVKNMEKDGDYDHSTKNLMRLYSELSKFSKK